MLYMHVKCGKKKPQTLADLNSSFTNGGVTDLFLQMPILPTVMSHLPIAKAKLLIDTASFNTFKCYIDSLHWNIPYVAEHFLQL